MNRDQGQGAAEVQHLGTSTCTAAEVELVKSLDRLYAKQLVSQLHCNLEGLIVGIAHYHQ
jgi:hypothetical protein